MTVPMRAPAAAPVDEASATLSPAGGGGETAAPSVRLLELFDLDDDILYSWRVGAGRFLFAASFTGGTESTVKSRMRHKESRKATKAGSRSPGAPSRSPALQVPTHRHARPVARPSVTVEDKFLRFRAPTRLAPGASLSDAASDAAVVPRATPAR